LICERYAVPLSPFQRENPKLLHAKTGAAVARAVFGEPEPIVSAICWHTTGRAAMSTLEKILYIADYMEPTRDFPGVEQLREATRRDLDEAVWLGLDQSLSHLRELGRSVDPDSREAWSYYRNTTERRQ
jgi:nicotinate-nucleotide adenylyltransferase